MMNIFENETIYGGWTKTGCVELKDAMPASMYASFDDEAVVTESDRGYGKSVCFFINGGQNKVYKNLSTTSDLKVGDKINKSACFVIVLKKQDETIYRISEKRED